MLEVIHLSYSYPGRSTRKAALQDLSFSVHPGEVLSIIGANGAGKSTLFRCIQGLLPEQTGSVLLNGVEVRQLPVRERAAQMAWIPQSSGSVFHYSVEEMVLMGTTATLGMLQSPGASQRRQAEEAMERIGITSLRRSCFHHLSGGEKQLVILARALAQGARTLLLDEPETGLDLAHQLRLHRQLRELAAEGYQILQITQDPEKASSVSDRILALREGQILAEGRPEEVLTAENIAAIYGLQACAEKRSRICVYLQ